MIVYDAIDDWSDPALGGEWWDPAVESWFASTADAVIASAPDLVRRMADLGVTATLVPNAVNVDLFTAAGPTAGDLPTDGSPILGYHGSLYGDWFDWDALYAVADAFPEASIVVIGDDKAPHRALPSNVRFLGLRAQVELPSYVRGFDVGLLPFVTTGTTHAVSPLKVYEYLACGVPVAAPPLRALDGVPSVFTAPDLIDAVRLALDAPPVDTIGFAASESWRARIESISVATGWALPEERAERVRVETRPVTHYRRNERVVETSAGRLPDRDDPS
jgi:glycosyltransferase involved in cell wall biosynthesis